MAKYRITVEQFDDTTGQYFPALREDGEPAIYEGTGLVLFAIEKVLDGFMASGAMLDVSIRQLTELIINDERLLKAAKQALAFTIINNIFKRDGQKATAETDKEEEGTCHR